MSLFCVVCDWSQPATASVPVSLPTTSFNENCVNSCHKRHPVLHWQRQCLCSGLIRLERCPRHGGPWAFAEHYIQQVWTERLSSAVASVIPVRPHSDCQHQQSMSTPSTLSCGVSQGSVLGPAHFVMYTKDLGELITDFSVLHLFFADDSQLLASTTPNGVADVCRRLEHVYLLFTIGVPVAAYS